MPQIPEIFHRLSLGIVGEPVGPGGEQRSRACIQKLRAHGMLKDFPFALCQVTAHSRRCPVNIVTMVLRGKFLRSRG